MVGGEGLEPPHVKTYAIYPREFAAEDFVKPYLRSRASNYFAIPRNINEVTEVGFEPTTSRVNLLERLLLVAFTSHH